VSGSCAGATREGGEGGARVCCLYSLGSMPFVVVCVPVVTRARLRARARSSIQASGAPNVLMYSAHV
jgi:hypothetical protein